MDALTGLTTQRCGLVSCPRRVTHPRMSATEHAILERLLELETAVAAARKAAPRPDVRPLLAGLDDLTRRLPPGTPPELLHYLHKKSYEKARLFLQGRDAENQLGNCRHV